MKVIEARNVNDALVTGFCWLLEHGKKRDSRNGPVYVADGPVTTVYEKPRERVLFWPERDANPFFHFMESLWMIAGRNDVDFVSHYAKNMLNFSDDGVTLHGAYGYRWRHHFGGDQLGLAGDLLRSDPDDRRVVVQMWDPNVDLGQEGKDFPCNTEILFRVSVYGKLDMTVFNRSNDIIWGAYGANAVHMSMLQEFMAAWINVPVGRYWQVSNNYHGYDETMVKHKGVKSNLMKDDPYELGVVSPYPMVSTDMDTWQQDLNIFLQDEPIIGFRDKFFRKVATPIHHAWEAWKEKDPEKGIDIMRQCIASDWRQACTEWLERRIK